MIARLLVLLIRGYQRSLSPLLGPVCRFSPSCSQYMLVCIQRFGVLRGLWLGTRRLARCHPFHPGGVDLPPSRSGDTGDPADTGEPSAGSADPAPCSHRAPQHPLPARSFEHTP